MRQQRRVYLQWPKNHFTVVVQVFPDPAADPSTGQSLPDPLPDPAGPEIKAQRLTFTHPNQRQPLEVELTTTPVSFPAQNYVGVRYWFLCPVCDRRVGKLYKPATEALWDRADFACRHCHRLSYASRNQYRQSELHFWGVLAKALTGVGGVAGLTELARRLETDEPLGTR